MRPGYRKLFHRLFDASSGAIVSATRLTGHNRYQDSEDNYSGEEEEEEDGKFAPQLQLDIALLHLLSSLAFNRTRG